VLLWTVSGEVLKDPFVYCFANDLFDSENMLTLIHAIVGRARDARTLADVCGMQTSATHSHRARWATAKHLLARLTKVAASEPSWRP